MMKRNDLEAQSKAREGEQREKQMNERMDWVIKWGLIVLMAFIFANVLAGCNTMAGLGKDIQAAAVGIQSEMADESPPPRYATRD